MSSNTWSSWPDITTADSLSYCCLMTFIRKM